MPNPWPPCSSATKMPGQPSKTNSSHCASVNPWSSSVARRRTSSSGNRDASRSRAESLIARCSSLKSKFTRSPEPGQPEHALGDDVLEDLGRAALDRVRPRPEEAVGPRLLVELGTFAGDVDGQLGQRLVDLGRVPLPERALGPGPAVLHLRGQAPVGVELEHL